MSSSVHSRMAANLAERIDLEFGAAGLCSNAAKEHVCGNIQDAAVVPPITVGGRFSGVERAEMFSFG